MVAPTLDFESRFTQQCLPSHCPWRGNQALFYIDMVYIVLHRYPESATLWQEIF